MSSKSTGIRLLIGTGSMAAFLGGWVLLAHAPKPVGATTAPIVQIDPPLPQFAAPQGLQLFPNLRNQPSFIMPRLRTHAS
jgi:hypothetical protein